MTPATATSLIGSIHVQPPTVRPGQPVFVQVLDAAGQPYTEDSSVTIAINGVESPARYYQFTQPGTATFVVRAVSGDIKELATATATIEGDPMTFRLGQGLYEQVWANLRC